MRSNILTTRAGRLAVASLTGLILWTGKGVRTNAAASLSLQTAPACPWPRDSDSDARPVIQNAQRSGRKSWMSALWQGEKVIFLP